MTDEPNEPAIGTHGSGAMQLRSASNLTPIHSLSCQGWPDRCAGFSDVPTPVARAGLQFRPAQQLRVDGDDHGARRHQHRADCW